MFIESQKCPQQAIWALSVRLPSPWPAFPPSAGGTQSRLGLSHKFILDTWTAAWRRSDFSLSSLSLTLWSCSWVAFYLWNNLLSLIHLSWNLTTIAHHENNKANRLNTLQVCTLRTSGRLSWDRLQHAVALCHTDRAELPQSFYESQAHHLPQTNSVSEKRSLCPETQSWHSAQSTQGHFQGPMSICSTLQTLH